MPISFPASPTVGQTSTQNGRIYTWSGYAWELVTASNAGSAGANNYVESDITGLTGGTVLTNIVKITQAGYNALQTKDPATVYYIVSG
jgi:hypothetical protein